MEEGEESRRMKTKALLMMFVCLCDKMEERVTAVMAE